MIEWLEIFAVTMLVFVGIFLGRFFSRLPKPYWLIGYLLPLLLVVLVGLSRKFPHLGFVPPISWITAGRTEFVLLAVGVTMLLTTPLSRLPHLGERILVSILMCIAALYYSVLPFLLPMLIREELAGLKTRYHPGGYVEQSTAYNCGPAAAATALRLLGVNADQGQLAILAHTSPTFGTAEDLLAQAIEKGYGESGIKVTHRPFDSIDQLKNGGFTLAVVKYSMMVDHFVVVLDVNDELVFIADPVLGQTAVSREEFQQTWRRSGIVITRQDSS